MKFKKNEPLTLRLAPSSLLKVEVFGDGVRIAFGYHVDTTFVVSCVLDDERARDLTRWLSAQGFGARGRKKTPVTEPPGKKCYRGRVCGSVPCEYDVE